MHSNSLYCYRWRKLLCRWNRCAVGLFDSQIGVTYQLQVNAVNTGALLQEPELELVSDSRQLPEFTQLLQPITLPGAQII
jgi:hypothetical protein